MNVIGIWRPTNTFTPPFQVSTLTQCYKTQISELETKLQKESEALKQQLASAQEYTDSKLNTKVLDTVIQSQFMNPVLLKDENSDGEMDINVSMIPREEGEVRLYLLFVLLRCVMHPTFIDYLMELYFTLIALGYTIKLITELMCAISYMNYPFLTRVFCIQTFLWLGCQRLMPELRLAQTFL